MNIGLVGHGLIEIPPKGYGAVEAVVGDYAELLQQCGNKVTVYNTRQPEIKEHDVVWYHDDRYALTAKKGIVTSHDPILFNRLNPLLSYFVKGDFKIGCLTKNHMQQFEEHGVSKSRLFHCPNGARADLIHFSNEPLHKDKILCLGMISQRKRQQVLSCLPNVHFAGAVSQYDAPKDFSFLQGKWLGAWSKRKVYEQLTNYAALILLSENEAAPLVVMEALMAGLPVIVSKAASANLPVASFIKILSEELIEDPVHLYTEVERFTFFPHNRKAIRAWAEQNIDWKVLVAKIEPELWHQ